MANPASQLVKECKYLQIHLFIFVPLVAIFHIYDKFLENYKSIHYIMPSIVFFLYARCRHYFDVDDNYYNVLMHNPCQVKLMGSFIKLISI